ncbi:MAG: hypothetical protein F9K23_15945 [Bacteroidetes bacterium]|nr:MAG: hypothetical protein F9K23_15945 [Bacteroidota bacterium]
MITEELKALVREEANNLKLHATPEELQNLDFEILYPSKPGLCIYGQMTHDCASPRAVELLNLCAKPFSNDVQVFETPYSDHLFPPRKGAFGLDFAPFSPIEFYICQEGAKNTELIAYLKGETNNLEL